MILLAGSLCFYIRAGGEALFVVLGTALLVYGATRLIDKIYTPYREEAAVLTPPQRIKLFATYKKKTKWVLYATLFFVVGFFSLVKIQRYFWPGGVLIVPLGLSYYTLSMVGYLLDVYREKTACEKNVFHFVTAVTFFPHIVQGPVSRYDGLMKQIKALPAFEYERACFGLQLMLWGYLKKLVLADTIALYTTSIFSSVREFSIAGVALAVLLYAVQLYADFSGCIDIVSGISQVAGIELDKNFNRPFFSKSAGEFWRRWHISLGTWFKDYIYIPIATASGFKNLVKKVRKKMGRQWGVILSVSVPSLAVWILTGLWHGTGLDYMLWGLYWGAILIFSEIFSDGFAKLRAKLHIDENAKAYALFRMARTFLIYCGGLMIIIPGSFANATGYIQRTLTDNCIIVIGVLVLASVEIMQEVLHNKGMHIRSFIAQYPLIVRWSVYLLAVALLLIYGRFGSGFDADTFIYAGF
jgi:D-alanyl-lipoteichoic acid acyltransferase DltB (MBOAT superfamily)